MGKSLSAIDLHKEIVRLKRELPEYYGWLYGVSKCAPQEAAVNFERAMSAYFKGYGDGRNVGKPVFKRKRVGAGSVRLTGTIKLFEKHIQLPTLGKVRLKESGYIPYDRPDVHINSVTVVYEAGKWYVSVNVCETVTVPMRTKSVTVKGFDMGVNSLVTDSDGVHYGNPRHTKKAEAKLRRLHRCVSRKVKGSNRRKKAILRLSREYQRVRNRRKDGLHKCTTSIAADPNVDVYVVEDLNIAGMVKNHKLAKSISDCGWGVLIRQLEYKCEWVGKRVIVAPRFYASSKLCSKCGEKNESLTLKDRVFVCPRCGHEMDRDENAAVNLRHYGEDYLLGERYPELQGNRAVGMVAQPNGYGQLGKS
jgi:putative transposase